MMAIRIAAMTGASYPYLRSMACDSAGLPGIIGYSGVIRAQRHRWSDTQSWEALWTENYNNRTGSRHLR